MLKRCLILGHLLLLNLATCARADIWEPGSALHEKIWYDWNAEELPEGKVASWRESSGAGVVASQPDPASQPMKTSNGVAFSQESSRLLIAKRLPIPERAHRAVVMLFKADVRNAQFDSGLLFSANGHQGSYNQGLPAFRYRKSGLYVINWAGRKEAEISLPAGSGSAWHVLISRRADGRHFASIDGRPEVAAEVTDFTIPRDNAQVATLIGDIRPQSIEWTLRRLMILHEELTEDDVERIAGWAMWEFGSERRLPQNHPYRTAPPEAVRAKTGFVGYTEEEWKKLTEWWDEENTAEEKEQHFGEPIEPLIEGFTTVWEDHFTELTVTDEVSGEGPWYSPGHPAATGPARSVRPGQEPEVFSQSGSELTITLKKVGNRWFSGSFTSVNVDGRGRTWNPAEYPTYFEARMKCSPGNYSSAWPAFWLKAVDEYYTQTVPRTEIDIYEGYNSDPDGHHQAFHSWKAARPYGDRPTRNYHISNYTGLSKNWPDAPVDLFDNKYHTYGGLINDKWLIFTFDGKELMRAPVRPDMLRPMFILVDLALHPREVEKAEGEYKLVVDYVRVQQKVDAGQSLSKN